MTSSPTVEGLFAIHKPTSITSAQVIRDVQKHFKPSALFQPWLQEEAARLKDARKHHHKARFRKDRGGRLEVKMGHGGTLDPMATGVLILGVGAGTKRLSDFLTCTKSYDTVLLFGQATDTYDVTGKTIARKPYDHITRAKVEEALEKFRGAIMQRPPIYSALRVQGKRLYEYAREGKEVPVEIQERPVTVEKLELVDWFEGSSHPYHWPETEADVEEKKVAQTVLHLEGTEGADASKDKVDTDTEAQNKASTMADTATTSGLKRGLEEDETSSDQQPSKKAKQDVDADSTEPAVTATSEVAKVRTSCPAPACRLHMTVTSGFYVRSLCHDLGEAVGSLGSMASLVRTRQGDFELGKNVFDYDELSKGEDVWGPQIKELLQKSKSERHS